MKKYIRLYHVSCGLYVDKSLFSPFAEKTGDYIRSKKKALEIYENISPSDFDRKELFLAKMKGMNTYNKTLFYVDVPFNLYQKYCVKDEFGRELTDDQKQEWLNEIVWFEGCKFSNPIKDDIFDIDGGLYSLEIKNLRPWTEKEDLILTKQI